MKKPNFFILGAPKCGTTSLADWLRQHPNVFMCEPKEPHFFNTDSGHHGALNLEHYLSFFDTAKESHVAVGEASVWYLVSKVAVQNILEFQPAARFIVCIRNPIEMAVSLHDQKRFSGDEPIADFLEAWNAQSARQNGETPLPATCTDVNHLLYGKSCLVGHQIQKLLTQIPKQRLHIVVMDDLEKRPFETYKEVLAFLELPEFCNVDLTPGNPSKKRKILWLRTLLRKVHILKGRLGIRKGTGVGALINSWNSIERVRQPVSQQVHSILRDFFQEDIRLCEDLTNRNFDHWLE